MPVSLNIVINEQGQINVNGPIHDKILCYGMLEAAKIAVMQYKGNGGLVLAGPGAVPKEQVPQVPKL